MITKLPQTYPELATDFPWIDGKLGQLGIDVRQAGAHAQMQHYLQRLRLEIAWTEDFLKHDQK